MQFAVHDCYSKLSGAATFSIVMCHRLGLLCEFKTANQFQESKLFPAETE